MATIWDTYNDIPISIPPIFSKPVDIMKIDDTLKLEWIINNDLLNLFKTCKPGKIFWCNEYFGIGNNFCLSCIPNNNTYLTNGFILRLHVIAALINIEIKCNMELKDEINDIHIKYHKPALWMTDANNFACYHAVLRKGEIEAFASLKIIVTVKRTK